MLNSKVLMGSRKESGDPDKLQCGKQEILGLQPWDV